MVNFFLLFLFQNFNSEAEIDICGYLKSLNCSEKLESKFCCHIKCYIGQCACAMAISVPPEVNPVPPVVSIVDAVPSEVSNIGVNVEKGGQLRPKCALQSVTSSVVDPIVGFVVNSVKPLVDSVSGVAVVESLPSVLPVVESGEVGTESETGTVEKA